MTSYFVAPDGADEPTLWEDIPGSDPAVVIRRAELPGRDQDLLWRVLTGVLCADRDTVERVAQRYQLIASADTWADISEHTREVIRADVRTILEVLAAVRGEQ